MESSTEVEVVYTTLNATALKMVAIDLICQGDVISLQIVAKDPVIPIFSVWHCSFSVPSTFIGLAPPKI